MSLELADIRSYFWVSYDYCVLLDACPVFFFFFCYVWLQVKYEIQTGRKNKKQPPHLHPPLITIRGRLLYIITRPTSRMPGRFHVIIPNINNQMWSSSCPRVRLADQVRLLVCVHGLWRQFKMTGMKRGVGR